MSCQSIAFSFKDGEKLPEMDYLSGIGNPYLTWSGDNNEGTNFIFLNTMDNVKKLHQNLGDFMLKYKQITFESEVEECLNGFNQEGFGVEGPDPLDGDYRGDSAPGISIKDFIG